MKLSYFREFVVLAKHLNFSIAANHLHMTQPGLSRHISGLEREIGIKLFERDTHGVQLTEKGEHFLKGIEKILNDYDFLCEAVAKGGIEKITIGVPYYGVKRYLSHVISPFESANPRLKINYMPAYPDAIVTGLLAKQVDVAVMPKVSYPFSEDLIFHDAFKEPVVLLVNHSHTLALKTAVHADEIKNENFITLKGDFGDALFEEWDKFCRKRGFAPPKKVLETATIEEAVLNMKPESGIMMLPGHLKQANLSGNVKWIDLLDEESYLTISLIHHADNRNPITKKFINFYLSHNSEQSYLRRI